jgi:hypothetical protein
MVLGVLLLLPGLALGATVSRETMEKHLDHSVEMYGNYAPVRLPIHNGVPVWNPTAVRIGKHPSMAGAGIWSDSGRLPRSMAFVRWPEVCGDGRIIWLIRSP